MEVVCLSQFVLQFVFALASLHSTPNLHDSQLLKLNLNIFITELLQNKVSYTGWSKQCYGQKH